MEAQPAYTRSWKEIEMMLDEAREQMYEQKSKFRHRKKLAIRQVAEEQRLNLLEPKAWLTC